MADGPKKRRPADIRELSKAMESLTLDSSNHLAKELIKGLQENAKMRDSMKHLLPDFRAMEAAMKATMSHFPPPAHMEQILATAREFDKLSANLALAFRPIVSKFGRATSIGLQLENILSATRVAEKINFEFPQLAVDFWPKEILADRLPLIESTLDNLKAFQSLRVNLLNPVAASNVWQSCPGALGLASRVVFDHGRFVRKLPPLIPEGDYVEEFEERLGLDLKVGEKLDSALTRIDPRLVRLRHRAVQDIHRADLESARSAMLNLREVFTDLLHILAPDEKVNVHVGRQGVSKKPTRNERIEYILRDAPKETKEIVHFDSSIQKSHKYAHTFAENSEIVRIYMSELENCILLLLTFADPAINQDLLAEPPIFD